MSRPIRRRVPYSQDDDILLMKYIAIHNPERPNRMGNALYRRLVENAEGKWPWSKRHSWQSWRERYKDNEERFEALIKRYQKKKGIIVGDNARYARSSQTSSVQNSTMNGRDVPVVMASSSSTRPVSPKREPESSQLTISGVQETANGQPLPDVPRNQQPSPKMYKGIARKTAHKTVVMSPSEPSESEDEEVDELVSDEGEPAEENAGDKKRKAGEVDVQGDHKRQRVNGHLPDEGHVERVGQCVSPEDNEGPTHPVPIVPTGANRALSSQRPQTPASTALEILSSFGDNVLNNKLTISRLLDVLSSKPEDQREVMEFAKARLSQVGTSSNTLENVQEQERLYPRLDKDDSGHGELAKTEGLMPGSWSNTQGPVASSSANPPGQTNGVPPADDPTTERSGQHHNNHGESPNHEPVFYPRPRVRKRVDAEDFFETPSPSPQKIDAAQPNSSNHQTPKAQDVRQQPHDNLESRALLPKRDPPRFSKDGFSRSFARSSRRQVSSQRRGHDVDSGSDTDVIPDEQHPEKEMNKQVTPNAAWPPARKASRVENKASPARIEPSAQKIVAVGVTKQPSQPSPTVKLAETIPKEAPEASVKRKGLKELGVTSLTSVDEPQPNVSAIRVQSGQTLSRMNRNKPQRANAEARNIREVGPSQVNRTSLPLGSTAEYIDKAEDIYAWRSEPQLTERRSASVSLTTESDPFLTKDHAHRLRQQEKGKGKEKGIVVSAKEKTKSEKKAEARARAERRKTFAGFPLQKPPEIDLRKRALQSGIAGNALPPLTRRVSFSPMHSLPLLRDDENQDQDQDEEQNQEESRINRRTSVTAIIDLSQEFPSPHAEISSADHAFIMRAGIQVLIQSIAQNHAVSEDFVRGIYDELGDLRATDRVVSRMRQVAEKAVEEELEKEKRKRRDSNMSVDAIPVSQILGSSSRQTHHRAESTSGRHEVGNNSNLANTRNRPVSGSPRRRLELQITPADEDPTFVRLRNRYVPPSASRAARLMRHRARRSSGLTSSPLNGFDLERELQFDADMNNEEENEEEEEEVSLVLTPQRSFKNPSASYPDLRPSLRDRSPLAGPSDAVDDYEDQSQVEEEPKEQPWTAEEDRILAAGDDDEAIKAIEEKRGKRAVKWRLVELGGGLDA